ncbi:ATP-binding protein [Actinoallomurus acaciae]|uniref:ATP-binding protein n=1 Tax=Actinoallomurus acaciae TaxID=502577 RepID=A0ABV5Y7L8_9ACTN
MCTSRELLVDPGHSSAPPEKAENAAYQLPLAPHPIAAEQARVLVRLACTGWKLGDVIDSVLLVTVELVTNAMKIGEVFRVAVSQQAGTVLIEVWDSSEAAPDRQQESVDRVDGRGLLLVEACSKDWGWRLEDHGGKTVWAAVEPPDLLDTSSAMPHSRARI